MGRARYNAKARQVIKTSVDNSQTRQIQLEFGKNEYGTAEGASNQLVLPSQKRLTKKIVEKKEKTRFLSKTQRKRLEKIVDKKKKKQNRAALIESLAAVQASNEEVGRMTSISAMQTIGAKRISELQQDTATVALVQSDVEPRKLSSIAGAKKRKRLFMLDGKETVTKKKYDPNVVGLDESSDDSSIETDEEDKTNITEISKPVELEVIEIKHQNDEIKSNEAEINEKNKINKGEKEHGEKKKNRKKDVIDIKDERKQLLKCPDILVEVTRDPKIQVARLKLPILGEEQKIMELINENEFLIVSGETGSGKTTQIPQFLYEAGYATRQMIGVTEPRRVATVAMAARVGHELGLTSREVSYLMRFEGNVTSDTKIKFMTDGVLLKEIQSDFLLSRYSVIILDEAHERSVYTDILLGLLSRIVPLRLKRGSPLRLIVMSATLRVEDFTQNTRLFKTPPPVVNIESRQFPVTNHFNKKTPENYLNEAYKKTVKIHTRLPEGGVLIFVTGQQEVHFLVRKLKTSFPYRKDMDYSKIISKNTAADVNDIELDSEPEDISSEDDEVQREMKRIRKKRKKAKLQVKELPKISLDDYDMPEDDGQADLAQGDEDSDGHLDSGSEAEDESMQASIRSCRQPLWVLPLFSMLDSGKQARVFDGPPVGARLCVVSTDVAETSLTIPGIKYVVDTGKKKNRVYDGLTGASAWRVGWVSQAGAEQRAGRAGRTGPGHTYRLYSSAVYQHELPPFAPPDIQTKPIDELVLQMKCMGIDKVVNFPFPSAPDRLNLRLAENRLEILGILERAEVNKHKKDDEELLKVTALGRAVSAFPLLPRYGKMLALSHQQNLLPYAVVMVAALSVPEVLTGKSASWPATGHGLLLGDPGVLLRAVGAAEFSKSKGEEQLFCAKYGVREKALKEIRKLRKQLTTEINLSVAGVELSVDPHLEPPNDNQARLLRQLLLSGLGDQVARKVGLDEVKEGEDRRKLKYAYHCGELEDPVHLHSDSLLRRTIPEWAVYQELYEAGHKDSSKMIMRNVTAIEPEWLPVYVPHLCNLGDPLTDPEPRFEQKTGRVRCHFKGSFGKAGWELPTVEIDFPNKMEKYKWFGRFLLEGLVFPKLKKYTSVLLSPPSTMIKSWARLQPRTEILLKALIRTQSGSRDQLRELWSKEPQYLLMEYLKWLPESAHNEATLLWPPV